MKRGPWGPQDGEPKTYRNLAWGGGGYASVSALFFYSTIHLHKELTPPTPTLHTAIVLGLSDKGPSLFLTLAAWPRPPVFSLG